MKPKNSLIFIVGPTACGKTSLALKLARCLGGEIVSADSMQVYRGMDIGTAKITAAETAGIPHHLIDIIDPEQPFSVADFHALAIGKIAEIAGRGNVPLVVGGTGLYINSLTNPYNFSGQAKADPVLRERLHGELAELGHAALHQRLSALDPAAAAHIHPRDTHRLLRALEVYQNCGKTISQLQAENPAPPAYAAVMVGLNLERGLLYRRIEQRVDRMLADGLVDEVRGLLARGVSRKAVSMQGLGYRQLAAYLAGELTLAEAVSFIKRDTRRFAKRQVTWFKRDQRITWFYPDHYREEGTLIEEVSRLIADRLKEEPYEADRIAGDVSQYSTEK